MVKKSTLLKKLSSYSALASVAIAASQKTDGQIIYTGLNKIVTKGDGIYYLDLNNDGTKDFIMTDSVSFHTTSGKDIDIGGIAGLTPGDSIERDPNLPGLYFADPNSFKNIIGASDKWISYATFDFCSVKSFKNKGVFAGKGDKYVGLKLSKAGKFYYGWMRINLNAKCDTLVIKGYAYNATAGDTITAGEVGTGIASINNAAAVLESFNPNPATTTANIIYTINVPGSVTLELYDITGRKIETLLNNAQQAPGLNRIPADVSGLSSGVYFCKLTVNGQAYTQKLVVAH